MDWVTRMLLDKWYDEYREKYNRQPTVAEYNEKIRELFGHKK